MNLAVIISDVKKTYLENMIDELIKSLSEQLVEQFDARFIGMPNTPETQTMFANEVGQLNRELERIVIRGRIN